MCQCPPRRWTPTPARAHISTTRKSTCLLFIICIHAVYITDTLL
ncbi:hypothetical protein SFRURICE_019366 [Spodoptera frugiperda]|uniref:SFRICE_027708 n=1 Tax=Spodoptera frugiperda TaxID=7108 RepID=A0A2H1V307_SPOFR|nr:hypothetical protein SFRURICE_019366 [Spodoptera frugiperda]